MRLGEIYEMCLAELVYNIHNIILYSSGRKLNRHYMPYLDTD